MNGYWYAIIIYLGFGFALGLRCKVKELIKGPDPTFGPICLRDFILVTVFGGLLFTLALSIADVTPHLLNQEYENQVSVP